MSAVDQFETEVVSASLFRNIWKARRQVFGTGHGVRNTCLKAAGLLFPLQTRFHGHQKAGPQPIVEA